MTKKKFNCDTCRIYVTIPLEKKEFFRAEINKYVDVLYKGSLTMNVLNGLLDDKDDEITRLKKIIKG